MKLFGYDISIRKSLDPVSSNAGAWFPVIREASGGAWQRDEKIEVDTALSHSAVFACVDLIAKDIGKLPARIARRSGGYWAPVDHVYDGLLRKPNPYQTRAQFLSAWITCKLLHGNVYALKQRNAAGRIIALHLLDPARVQPLVSSGDGSVFYRLSMSQLAGLHEDVTVPAREIIHDRGITPFHPLVGVSPLMAAGIAANQGLAIQKNAVAFFKNAARPSVVLTAPGLVTREKATEIKNYWDAAYRGPNAGSVAILSDGIKPELMTMTSADAQVIEQLNFTAQDVCRAFHVPAWKIGAGPAAPYTSAEQTGLTYYADCLQALIESLEQCLDEGLNLPANERTELDVDALLRMDTIARFDAYGKAIGAGWMMPNEARQREGMAPVEGGDTCYMQQQNYALAALAHRSTPEKSV